MTASRSVRAWDLPTRIFHWVLVFLIVSAWVSIEFSNEIGDTTMQWHRYNGYALLVVIAWRLLWGLFGSSTSRFRNFITGPRAAASYAAGLLRGREKHYLGHNPLGSYMVLALLATVAFQTILGLFSTEHNYLTWGPLAPLISDSLTKSITGLHQEFFDSAILPLVGVHIVANFAYAAFKRDPLVKAMVTGRKPAGDYADEAEAQITGAPMVRALACLVVSAAIVLGGILAAGGKLLY